jgi:hypothetical protein
VTCGTAIVAARPQSTAWGVSILHESPMCLSRDPLALVASVSEGCVDRWSCQAPGSFLAVSGAAPAGSPGWLDPQAWAFQMLKQPHSRSVQPLMVAPWWPPSSLGVPPWVPGPHRGSAPPPRVWCHSAVRWGGRLGCFSSGAFGERCPGCSSAPL